MEHDGVKMGSGRLDGKDIDVELTFEVKLNEARK